MSSSRQTGLKFGTTYPRMELGTDPDVLGQWVRDVEQIGYEWGPPLGHQWDFFMATDTSARCSWGVSNKLILVDPTMTGCIHHFASFQRNGCS
jgi:hypothetical protein